MKFGTAAPSLSDIGINTLSDLFDASKMVVLSMFFPFFIMYP